MKPFTLASQQPSVSLIKVTCYPEFTSSACQYECKHEDIARVAYTEACHEKCMVIQCGLILDPEFPFMCLTRWSSLLCHVLEIRCPFSCKNKTFSEAILPFL